MPIEKNKVIAFHYVLRNEQGDQVEASSSDEPMVYLHGNYRNVLPALEEALAGQDKGDELSVTLPPEKAYGLRQEGSMQRVPIKHLLTKHKRYQPGMTVKVNTKEGPRDVMVVKAGRFNLDVDTNHPLAGQTVTFDIQVHDIRDATPEEIQHGHSHGWAGHGHHH